MTPPQKDLLDLLEWSSPRVETDQNTDLSLLSNTTQICSYPIAKKSKNQLR